MGVAVRAAGPISGNCWIRLVTAVPGERVGEDVDLGGQMQQRADLAGARLGQGTGAEDPQLGDRLPVEDFGQAVLVDFDTRHDQHKGKATRGMRSWLA